MALYFASQGAGRMAWPFAGGVVRLLFLIAAGSLYGASSLETVYWIVVAGFILFGGIIAFGMASGLAWGRAFAARRAAQPAA
jgi:hypothetical protein